MKVAIIFLCLLSGCFSLPTFSSSDSQAKISLASSSKELQAYSLLDQNPPRSVSRLNGNVNLEPLQAIVVHILSSITKQIKEKGNDNNILLNS